MTNRTPRNGALLWALAALLLASSPLAGRAQTTAEVFHDTVGTQAYVYGVPLVEVYKYMHLQSVDPTYPGHTPFNKLRHIREAIVIDDPDITVPNADTLYSYAWLHLNDEPIVIHVPELSDRYYSLLLMDAHNDAITYIGTRRTGTDEGYFVVAGPDWNGQLPPEIWKIVRKDASRKRRAEMKATRACQKKGVCEAPTQTPEEQEPLAFLDSPRDGTPTLGFIRSPTPFVFILGRVLVFDNDDDLPNAHAIQDQMRTFPLSTWGTAEDDYPGVELPGLPPYDVSDPVNFFKLLQVSLELNPPPVRDASVINLLSQIGVAPGQDFDPAALDATARQALTGAVQKGWDLIQSYYFKRGYYVGGGWGTGYKIGRYGPDLYMRAAVVSVGLGGNLEEEARYYKAIIDSQFGALTGANQYEVTVTEQPPLNELGFWSMTVYDPDTEQLVPNSLGRYAIGDRTQGLDREPDGSYTLYLQSQPPTPDKLNNWLPIPEGSFYLLWRNYLPTEDVLNDTWRPPAVRRVP